MSAERAKPGDTIEIITSSIDINRWAIGRQFLVMECPDDEKDNSRFFGGTWIECFVEGAICITDPENYRIIKHADKHNVDVFLDKQRDTNLRSVFG